MIVSLFVRLVDWLFVSSLVCVCVCLLVCLFICLCVVCFAFVFVCVFCLFVCLLVCWFVWLFVNVCVGRLRPRQSSGKLNASLKRAQYKPTVSLR